MKAKQSTGKLEANRHPMIPELVVEQHKTKGSSHLTGTCSDSEDRTASLPAHKTGTLRLTLKLTLNNNANHGHGHRDSGRTVL